MIFVRSPRFSFHFTSKNWINFELSTCICLAVSLIEFVVFNTTQLICSLNLDKNMDKKTVTRFIPKNGSKGYLVNFESRNGDVFEKKKNK